MHVVEHVGLGRYGDPVDVNGSARACVELARVLAPVVASTSPPAVGRPRVCFNAHRVHSVEQVRSYLPGLTLLAFDAVLDDGTWVEGCDPSRVADQEYALGLFTLTR